MCVCVCVCVRACVRACVRSKCPSLFHGEQLNTSSERVYPLPSISLHEDRVRGLQMDWERGREGERERGREGEGERGREGGREETEIVFTVIYNAVTYQSV